MNKNRTENIGMIWFVAIRGILIILFMGSVIFSNFKLGSIMWIADSIYFFAILIIGIILIFDLGEGSKIIFSIILTNVINSYYNYIIYSSVKSLRMHQLEKIQEKEIKNVEKNSLKEKDKEKEIKDIEKNSLKEKDQEKDKEKEKEKVDIDPPNQINTLKKFESEKNENSYRNNNDREIKLINADDVELKIDNPTEEQNINENNNNQKNDL